MSGALNGGFSGSFSGDLSGDFSGDLISMLSIGFAGEELPPVGRMGKRGLRGLLERESCRDGDRASGSMFSSLGLSSSVNGAISLPDRILECRILEGDGFSFEGLSVLLSWTSETKGELWLALASGASAAGAFGSAGVPSMVSSCATRRAVAGVVVMLRAALGRGDSGAAIMSVFVGCFQGTR